MNYTLVFLLTGLLAGCTGTIYTIKDPKLEPGKRVNGIIVYQPRAIVVESKTTQLQDKDGKIIASECNDGNNENCCTAVPSSEVMTLPDYEHPYLVSYDAAWFESHNLSLNLEKGVITAINSQSTSAAKETLDALSGALGAGANLAKTIAPFVALTAAETIETKQPSGKKEQRHLACNTGKIITGCKDLILDQDQ